jgi:hypothetical protein
LIKNLKKNNNIVLQLQKIVVPLRLRFGILMAG